MTLLHQIEKIKILPLDVEKQKPKKDFSKEVKCATTEHQNLLKRCKNTKNNLGKVHISSKYLPVCILSNFRGLVKKGTQNQTLKHIQDEKKKNHKCETCGISLSRTGNMMMICYVRTTSNQKSASDLFSAGPHNTFL